MPRTDQLQANIDGLRPAIQKREKRRCCGRHRSKLGQEHQESSTGDWVSPVLRHGRRMAGALSFVGVDCPYSERSDRVSGPGSPERVAPAHHPSGGTGQPRKNGANQHFMEWQRGLYN
jgi:hypothetical protein